MAMIRVCKDCGFENRKAGCANCNKTCPVCGGNIIKMDLVDYIQSKEKKSEEDLRIDS